MDLRGLLTSELDGVAYEVLEQLRQLRGIRRHDRKLLVGDHCARFCDGGFEIRKRLIQNSIAIARFRRFASSSDPGIRQQVIDERLHPTDAIDRVSDQLVGSAIQLTLISLPENLNTT